MTTYLYGVDHTPELLRTNRFANPSFEESTDGVTASSGDFEPLDRTEAIQGAPEVQAGQASLRWTTSATPSATSSLSQQLDGQVTAGRWIAACLPVRMDQWTGRAQVKIFPDAPAVGEGTILAAPAGDWVYPVATFLMPGTDDQEATAHLYIYGETADTPPAAAEGNTDAWIATVADTEADALAALEPYFDGDTVVTEPLLVYDWTGTPHASTSTESLLHPLTPDLVLNYRHELDTGVTVHRPVTGPPKIVRRTNPRYPGGRLELYCKTEELAVQLEDLCNGSRSVRLISDDIPGAPFTFHPHGQVQTVWNSPYRSWTVTVPYVRTS